MIRIFETGDLHIGRKYADKNKHPEGKALAEKRREALNEIIEHANLEKCDFLTVTGDLFDNTNINSIGKKAISGVVEEFAKFQGTVLILPGNHDYYARDTVADVWQYFMKESEGKDNIVFLNSFEPYDFIVGEDKVIIYPAYCQEKTAANNNLGWIKELDLHEDDVYKIGMAHGALKGQTIDNNEAYFLMTEQELNDIAVDLWLIGHTHVMFPRELTEEYKETNSKIFNAGTHVQTDVHNDTDGNCFIIEIDKETSDKTIIRAKRYLSGNVFFKRISVQVEPNGSGHELKEAITKVVADIALNTSVSLEISGTVSRDEYKLREQIYAECLDKFFEHPRPNDSELLEHISEEFIKSEFAEFSFPAKLLMKLIDDPKKAQMAYDLLISKKCQA